VNSKGRGPVSFRNRIRVFGAGIAAVGGLAVGVPGVAAAQSQTATDVVVAAPTGCQAKKFTNGLGEATCTGGNGLFRVTITCKRSTGSIYQSHGPWKAPGPKARSARWCGASSDKITYAGVQKTTG
jgi:hypothetical protein